MYRSYFVDDEPLVLQELTGNPLFAECGYQVIGSNTNPVAAVKQIMRLRPDVVFTDLVMPELSGVDLMARLKDNGFNCEFVVISAYPEFAESRRFFLLGGFDYILKPLSSHGLQYLLSRLTVKLAASKPPDIDSMNTASLTLNMIIAELHRTPFERHTLESISSMFHLSATYVCRLFANNLDDTFVGYLNKLRMEKAAKMLLDTGKEVKEVSRDCGYRDYFYFCRTFRKHHSCTPSEYRERKR
jgi:YesN/AraC family two-component response regulator